MTDAANNVRVCLRIRPLLGAELTNGETTNATALPDGQTVRVMTNQSTFNRQLEAHQYRLDSCCGPDMTQREFFHHSGVESFCDNAIEGQAATVFCFGQTGSGKTFTMSGPHMADPIEGSNVQAKELVAGVDETQTDTDSMGLQYRGVHYIANAVKAMNAALIAEQREKGATEAQLAGYVPLTMRASYVEIYQEQVNDLLNGTENLKIRWSQGAQSFFIENLMIVTCDDVTDLLAVLGEGGANRKRAAHKLNVDSSRSHVLFTIYFERRETINSPPKYGKINFVDLAGSERLKDSESVGVNADETRSINKSLFTLGKVISALSRQSTLKQKQHNQSGPPSSLDGTLSADDVFVPYRDSSLTKLLMDSLGGSCRTLMIACITPAQRFTDESIRTIVYAMRTRNIVNSIPRVRMDPTQRQVYELKTELEYLKKENAALKARLMALEGGDASSLLLLSSSSSNPKGGAAPTANAAGGKQPIAIQHNYVGAEDSTNDPNSNALQGGMGGKYQTPRGQHSVGSNVPASQAAVNPSNKSLSSPSNPSVAIGAYDGLKGPTLQHLIPRPQQQQQNVSSATPSLPPLPNKGNASKASPLSVKTNTFIPGNADPQNVGATPKNRVAVAGGLPPVHGSGSGGGNGGTTPRAPSSQPPSSQDVPPTLTSPTINTTSVPPNRRSSTGGSRAANPSLARAGGRATPNQTPAAHASNSAPTTATTIQTSVQPPIRAGEESSSYANAEYPTAEDDEEVDSRDNNAVYTDGSTQAPSIHGNNTNNNTPTRHESPRPTTLSRSGVEEGGSAHRENGSQQRRGSKEMPHSSGNSAPPPPLPPASHSTVANPRNNSATKDEEGPTSNSSNKAITSPDGAVLAAAWASQPTMTVAGLKDFGFKPAAKRSQRL